VVVVIAYELVATSTPGAISVKRPIERVYHQRPSLGRLGGQLHFELDASEKLLTELTTLAASLVTVAICAAEGLDDRAATALLSASTDDVMALVSLGKSLLAELTSVVASLWIVLTCEVKPLMPLLAVRLVNPLIELLRLVRSVQ
jgi:hypothetical protein